MTIQISCVGSSGHCRVKIRLTVHVELEPGAVILVRVQPVIHDVRKDPLE